MKDAAADPGELTGGRRGRLRRPRHRRGHGPQGIPVTGAIPTSVAAVTQGTIVNKASRPRRDRTVRIGHPSGVIYVDAQVEQDGDTVHVTQASVVRTSRRIMEGTVLVNTNRVPWLAGAPHGHSAGQTAPAAGAARHAAGDHDHQLAHREALAAS